jgi:hypothetical protein
MKNTLAIGTAVTTAALTLLTAQASVKASTFAGIPIEEEFIVAQWIYVDSSWDSIVTTLAEENLLDTKSTLTYEGTFNIFQDSNSDFFGDISGTLSGTYLGDKYEINYLGDVTTEILSNPGKQLKASFTSSGKWGDDPNIPV